MTEAAAETPRLFHLVQTALWARALQTEQPYFPPTYAQVHAAEHVYVVRLCALIVVHAEGALQTPA